MTEFSEQLEHLDKVLQRLGLNRSDFDLFLLGDGSGTVANRACGWYCSVVHNSGVYPISTCSGGGNHGTNNYAELMVYVYGLSCVFSIDPAPKRVLIVSDSKITVDCGNGDASRNVNLPLWASIDWYKQAGWKLTWRHVMRNSNQFTARADNVAGEIRVSLKGYEDG